MENQEPRLGYKNLIRAKREGKIKAFFSLLIPTESMGTIELTNCKVIESNNGRFISLPSRAVKGGGKVVDLSTGTVTRNPNGLRWFNTIKFDSLKRHDETM